MTPETARTLDAQARLRQAAVAEANRLRAEAIDDFWHGAYAWAHAWMAGGVSRAGRMADRLHQRLERHRLHRLQKGL